MTTLTINIDNDKDLPVLKEILNRFGLNYRIDENTYSDNSEEELYVKFKESLSEIKDWESGKIKLQSAKKAIAEIESELDNGV